MPRVVETGCVSPLVAMALSAARAMALVVAMAGALLPAAARAQADVPLFESYCGDYKWTGVPVFHAIRLDFRHRKPRSDSKLDIDGVGSSTSPRDGVKTDISVRAVFDPRTGRISMTESVGGDVADWVTDGSYEGQVEPDGSAIVAIWTSRQPPHDRGVLRLWRCAPGPSS